MKYNKALQTITILKKTIKEQDGSIHALELIVEQQTKMIKTLKEFNEYLQELLKKKVTDEKNK